MFPFDDVIMIKNCSIEIHSRVFLITAQTTVQHLFELSFAVILQQAIAWYNVNQALWGHMVTLGCDENVVLSYSLQCPSGVHTG